MQNNITDLTIEVQGTELPEVDFNQVNQGQSGLFCCKLIK